MEGGQGDVLEEHTDVRQGMCYLVKATLVLFFQDEPKSISDVPALATGKLWETEAQPLTSSFPPSSQSPVSVSASRSPSSHASETPYLCLSPFCLSVHVANVTDLSIYLKEFAACVGATPLSSAPPVAPSPSVSHVTSCSTATPAGPLTGESSQRCPGQVSIHYVVPVWYPLVGTRQH